jgi:hypothetical protein
MLGSLALAPIAPLIVRPIAAAFLPSGHPLVANLGVWRQVVVNEPVRLVTGHGFETALRGRFTGLLPQTAPNTLPFEIWYDLGVIGALAAAAALFFAATRAGREDPPLVPAIMGAFATAFAFACLGVSTAQMWWFTSLIGLVLIFVAAERGQFRTTRPKANFLRPVNDR